MPEIINLLKCFRARLDSTLLLWTRLLLLSLPLSLICLSLCLCLHVFVCVWEWEGVGCAWVCLTFNILTSYFKNVKLCKHVALADCLTPLPTLPSWLRCLCLCSCHAYHDPPFTRCWWFCRPTDNVTVKMSTQCKEKQQQKLSHTHTQTHTHIERDTVITYVYFAEHFAGNSTTLARPSTWAANASAWMEAAAF